MTDITKNFVDISQRLSKAGEKYLLDIKPKAQTIAVSKTHSIEKIEPLLKANHYIYGENKIQEAQSKWPELKAKYPDVELHLIGALQTNKAADAVALFDVIHTLDRPKLAKILASEFKKQNKTLPCFIQVNTGEEEQKSGVTPQEADEFIKQCASEYNLPIIGLMCIPPENEEPAMHFGLLKNIAERNKKHFTKFKNSPLPYQLSMGMSADFELAATMGATHVRVGSAIFGERG